MDMRRLTSFSIRGLVLMTTGVCIGLALIGSRVRQQRRATASVESVLGRVLYDFQLSESSHFDLQRRSRVPKWLLDGLGVDYFHSVVAVDLDSPMVTDRTLQDVARLRQIRYLIISDSTITNAGLSHLGRLPCLRSLNINNSHVNNDSLPAIVSLSQLEELIIQDAPITDNGLRHLRNMTGLRKLILDRTSVTEVGVAELQSALPNCTIDF
jgi:hypothetical protein